jgi:hypothetical protein
MKKLTVTFLLAGLTAGCGMKDTPSETLGGGRIVNIADDCTILGQNKNRIYQIEARFSRLANGGILLLDIMGTSESIDSRVACSSPIFDSELVKRPNDPKGPQLFALYDMGFGANLEKIYPTTLAFTHLPLPLSKTLSNPSLAVNYGEKSATLFLRKPTSSISKPDYLEIPFTCKSISATALKEIELLRPEFGVGIW